MFGTKNGLLRVLITKIFLLSSLISFSQIEEDYDYKREILWGVNKNSNSGLIGGLVLRYAQLKSEDLFTTYGLEFINVSHPKESKYAGQTGTKFVWGKQNYLYAIRMQYGLDKVLFKKAPQQGVQINANAAGGLTIGLEAPYYVKTAGGEFVQYDPVKYPSLAAISGSGKIWKSLGESKIVPGLNAKSGITFEFGTFRNNVTGVEVGVMTELYARTIKIIPTQKNRAFYPSAFFTFFWGTRR